MRMQGAGCMIHGALYSVSGIMNDVSIVFSFTFSCNACSLVAKKSSFPESGWSGLKVAY